MVVITVTIKAVMVNEVGYDAVAVITVIIKAVMVN